MLWTWLAAEVTGNASQVDRVWTFLPVIYTAWFTYFPTFESAPLEYSIHGVSGRSWLMLSLQVMWMWRLSYNTWRRGLFALSDEDYRWEYVRNSMPKWAFRIFNLTFIAIAQNIILFLLGFPAYYALKQPYTPLGLSDYALTTLVLITQAMEFTADNQQWSYQNFKRSDKISSNEWPGANIQWTENDKKRGFVTRGLWGWSRHPNFACEQTFWILMCCFPIFASPRLTKLAPENLTPLQPLLPALVLCSLFFASAGFSESLTNKKYPSYSAYKKRVGMFVPIVTIAKGLFWGLANKERKAKLDEAVWGDPLKVKGAKKE